MSVAEFNTIIKFMSPEQFFCAMNPLSTYSQFKQRLHEEKKKKDAEEWKQAAEAREATESEWDERQVEESGYVSDEEIAAQETKVHAEFVKAEEWGGGETIAKNF
jgi:hypothetical protein